MTFPRTSVGSGTTKVSSQALPFTVTDIDMWDTVAAAIINQPDVTWQMTGDASLTANFGGIKLIPAQRIWLASFYPLDLAFDP